MDDDEKQEETRQALALLVVAGFVEGWCDNPARLRGRAGVEALLKAWIVSASRKALRRAGVPVAVEAERLSQVLQIPVVIVPGSRVAVVPIMAAGAGAEA